MNKWVCEDWRCGWCGYNEEVLTAPDPFNEGFLLYACPDCREVNTLVSACIEPGCEKQANCGTPTPDGYKLTCSEHSLKRNK